LSITKEKPPTKYENPEHDVSLNYFIDVKRLDKIIRRLDKRLKKSDSEESIIKLANAIGLLTSKKIDIANIVWGIEDLLKRK